MRPFERLSDWRWLLLAALLALYLTLALVQLGLPGLHYDEAREAGVNAMELLTGAPVTPFRGATVDLFGVRLPLMVQDYIGAANVYLALPLLALTGVGVPNLRLLSVLTGLAALLAVERAVSEWWRWRMAGPVEITDSVAQPPARTSLSWPGLAAVALLAASPSFVFWSRQGVFVTNLTQPLAFVCLWQGVRWLRSGRSSALLWSALAAGSALYAKLLAAWVIVPFALLAAGCWLWRRRGGNAPRLSAGLLLATAALFLLPLTPLLLFNVQTGGTLAAVGGNLTQSYYGIDNLNLAANLPVRLRQLRQMIAGDHLWYLGGLYANSLAPWLAAIAALAGLARRPDRLAAPIALLAAALLCSLFTISDLFITHYALLQPLAAGVAALGLAAALDGAAPTAQHRVQHGLRRLLPLLFIALWLAFDLSATLRYHTALSRTGGLAGHSDAGYHLAYHLQYNGMGAPVALDWGFDAPIRFLTNGAVTPIELFGYASPAQPDDDFAARLAPFLSNSDVVYLLHAPQAEVFAGRRAVFLEQSIAAGGAPYIEAQFTQRDGTPLFELWRVRRAD